MEEVNEERKARLKPYTRVGIVAVTFFVAGVASMVFAYAAENQSAAEKLRVTEASETISKTISPSIGIVNELESQMNTGQAAFADTSLEPDPATRLDLLKVGAGTNNQVEKLIKELESQPQSFDGEDELLARLKTENAALTEAGTAAGGLLVANTITSGGEPVAAAMAASNDAFAKESKTVSELSNKYQEALAAASARATAKPREVAPIGFTFGIMAFTIAILISVVVFIGARREHRIIEKEQRERAIEIRRTDFETRLQRALDLAETEEDVFPVVSEALKRVAGAKVGELLIADSSRAHFRRAAANVDEDIIGCGVTAPEECPAARRSQAITFTNSEALDACRHLRDRPDGACSATCNPVRIAGGTVGVVHIVGEPDAAPSHETVSLIDLVTRKTAERVGLLRAFAQAETQARTDALTGLLNRRSLETEVNRLVDDGSRYVVAFGDLDLFKRLNDVHGHAAGDRALRVSSRGPSETACALATSSPATEVRSSSSSCRTATPRPHRKSSNGSASASGATCRPPRRPA